MKWGISLSYPVFGPDGRTLAVGSGDGRIWLWNTRNPAHPALLGQPLIGPTPYVDAVAFSPDGHTLVTGSGDGSVWLWNTSSPRSHNPARPAAYQPVPFRRFGGLQPDGHTLAAGSEDDRIWFWSLDMTQVTARICAASSDILTRARWQQYIPELPYDPPCRQR